MPVFENFPLARRCILSLLSAETSASFDIVVIDDGSRLPFSFEILVKETDWENKFNVATYDLLVSDHKEALALRVQEGSDGKHFVRILRSDTNRGFPRTVNLGFKVSEPNDVVILNSDTVVFDNWLDRLAVSPKPLDHVGSVTAMTNNGTISSYPVSRRYGIDEVNRVSLNQARHISEAIQHLPLQGLVETPTAIGHCVYFPRGALNQVGVFDAKSFGRGYGEENDWSQRAIKHGLNNFISPNLYVYHEGGASFGESSLPRKRTAQRIIDRRYPSYSEQVERFVRLNPLGRAFRRIDRSRCEQVCGPKTKLLITHHFAGGVKRFVTERILTLEESGYATAIMFASPQSGFSFGLGSRGELSWSVENGNLTGVVAEEILALLNVESIEVHSLVGFANMEDFKTLMNVASKLGVEIDYWAHDYSAVCPRFHLVDHTRRFCGLPLSEAQCNRCLKLGGTFTAHAISDVSTYRNDYREIFSAMSKVYAATEKQKSNLSRVLGTFEIENREHWSNNRLPTSQESEDLAYL